MFRKYDQSYYVHQNMEINYQLHAAKKLSIGGS